MKKFLLLLVTTVVAGLLGVHACYANEPRYAIVVDAGSSGTRLHLFAYENTQPLPAITDQFNISVHPGLSSFVDHPEQAVASFEKLFTAVMQELEKAHIDPRTVTVNILGTAGMRLLSEADQTKTVPDVARLS